MYVYIHITHTYIHTHILKAHIYTHTHTHTHIHACMHAYIHAYKERERVEGVGEDREGKRKRRRERGRGLHACACACVRARKCVCACVREFPRARARTSAGGRAAAWRGSPRTSPHRLCTDPKAAQDQEKTRFQLLPVSVSFHGPVRTRKPQKCPRLRVLNHKTHLRHFPSLSFLRIREELETFSVRATRGSEPGGAPREGLSRAAPLNAILSRAARGSPRTSSSPRPRRGRRRGRGRGSGGGPGRRGGWRRGGAGPSWWTSATRASRAGALDREYASTICNSCYSATVLYATRATVLYATRASRAGAPPSIRGSSQARCTGSEIARDFAISCLELGRCAAFDSKGLASEICEKRDCARFRSLVPRVGPVRVARARA